MLSLQRDDDVEGDDKDELYNSVMSLPFGGGVACQDICSFDVKTVFIKSLSIDPVLLWNDWVAYIDQ